MSQIEVILRIFVFVLLLWVECASASNNTFCENEAVGSFFSKIIYIPKTPSKGMRLSVVIKI